jgi:hypothetical protein
MKKFNKYGAEHQQKAQLFNKLVGPTPPTPAEQLLIEQVNDNLKFLLKVKPMNEKNIKDFILLCR